MRRQCVPGSLSPPPESEPGFEASAPIAAELAAPVDTKPLEYAASNEALCSGVNTVFLLLIALARVASSDQILH